MDYLFEPFEHPSGKSFLQHPFIGYDPGHSDPNQIGRGASNQKRAGAAAGNDIEN